MRASDWLWRRQHGDGHWCGELQGDTILESEYILLLAWLGEADSESVRQAARYLLNQQLPGGGWSQYPGGRLDVSISVKAYFALKLAGHSADAEPLRRARDAIRASGGADSVNSFTRFYLAMLGQIPFDLCPAVPPEMVLLPDWSPINIYRMSSWSRTIFVPLSIVWAQRPVRSLPAQLGIEELFIRPPRQWPALRPPQAHRSVGDRWWEAFFHGVDALLKTLEASRLRPLRRRALRAAERWMLERFADSDGLGAIFPPIIWSWVALKCLGYPNDSPPVVDCRRQLTALMIEDQQGLRLQPCLSPVWDTAIALRSLVGAEGAACRADRVERAMEWLLNKEVRCDGDWSRRARVEPGGWFFEYRNAFYPDIDDTIMVMMALREAAAAGWATERPCEKAGQTAFRTRTEPQADRIRAACERGVAWVLAMQNRDGGWGAFDKDNDQQFLCKVPFADHNAMIDPSTPDITARVLEALSQFGLRAGDGCIDRALEFLRRTQEPDGSWFGRWGVNYIYGTWQVLTGLAAAGVERSDPIVRRGVAWLISHQQPSGGWGESADSYGDPALRGRGPVTASQTAWAVLGLIAAGESDQPAVARAVAWLIENQQPDGGWLEEEFTGTGFPLVFYLRYHYYPVYFPLLALRRWRRQ